jgi:hypothetical protein
MAISDLGFSSNLRRRQKVKKAGAEKERKKKFFYTPRAAVWGVGFSTTRKAQDTG